VGSIEIIGSERLIYRRETIAQSAGLLDASAFGGLRLLLNESAPFGHHACEVRTAGQLFGGSRELGKELRARELGSASHRGVLGGLGAGVVSEGFRSQLLGSGPDSSRLSQRALGVVSFSEERLVLSELDSGLLACASILPNHGFQAAADASQLRNQPSQV
jgi:hypothetical protein